MKVGLIRRAAAASKTDARPSMTSVPHVSGKVKIRAAALGLTRIMTRRDMPLTGPLPRAARRDATYL